MLVYWLCVLTRH